MNDWTGEYCILRIIAAGQDGPEEGSALPVEAAVLRVRGGREAWRDSWLIDPGVPVPVSLRERSGRSEEEHRRGISPQEAAMRVRGHIEGLPVVVYGRENLEASFPADGAPAAAAAGLADARQLAWLALPYLRDHSLDAVVSSLLQERLPWRALEEALLIHRLLAACREAWMEGHPRLRAAVLASLRVAGNPWYFFLAGEGAGKRAGGRTRAERDAPPRFPDLVELLPATSGPGDAPGLPGAPRAATAAGDADTAAHPVPPGERATGGTHVSPEDVERFLAPGGALSRHYPFHETRPQQVAMARAVAEALNDSAFLAVEAGTGVGKSLAYLVPGALYARAAGVPLVVSTYTRNLQEQLFHRDLPLLARAMGSLDFSLLKGRSNYICLRKWSSWCDTLSRGQPVLPLAGLAPAEGYAFLVSWMVRSPSGDLEEISMSLRLCLAGFLEEISSDPDECPRARCPLRERCRVERARHLAARSDVVVVNHALLLSQAAAGEPASSTPAVPPHRHLVIDEAHHLEDVATDAFGASFSLSSCLHNLEEVSPAGRFHAAWNELSPHEPLLRELEEPGGEARELSCQFMEFATRDLLPLLPDAGDPPREGGEPQRRRLTASEFAHPDWESLCERGRALAARLQRIADRLAETAGKVPPRCRDDGQDEVTHVVHRAEALARKLEREASALLVFFQDPQDPDFSLHIRWLETAASQVRGGAPPALYLKCAPVNVGGELASFFTDNLSAAVLTSASLRVPGERDGFAFFLRRTGLDQVEERGRELRLLSLDSPFDYARQSRLFAVPDMPDPAAGRASPGRFREVPHEELCAAIEEVLAATGGRALVLLTSHRQVRRLHSLLRPRLEKMGISCLCQRRDVPNALLLERFREDRDSVLLATEAFWEGVDVPGESLSAVIMAKLPFRHPQDPVTAGRVDHYERACGDGWNAYYLPLAVTLFRQGIGRLIRRSTDSGVVVLLDPRFLTRGYSRNFRAALPPGMRVEVVTARELREAVREFFAENA
ncbi:MAG: hypothetical protein H5T73_03825 [Actinobacteria bacterium]|nr:hypothetical protein [Actinomycetota bacterium]